MERQFSFGHSTLHLVLGDITEMRVDAIVNAANEQLILGAGVAGAIRRKGGPKIQEECSKIGGTFTGGAVITGAGDLPASYVIHAVGPRSGDAAGDEKLALATRNSLLRAGEKKLKSIAFPAISTGIFGFPVERCARIMLSETANFFDEETTVTDIYFCLWEERVFKIFERQGNALFGF